MQIVELFSGAGGMAQGAHDAGFETLLAVDSDADACKTYQRNFPNTQVVCGDVRQINFDAVLPDQFAGLAYGAPCNDYSMAGKRQGLQGNYGPLYSYGVEVTRMRQPEFFVFENVSGILSKGFDIIKNDMESAGYDLFQHHYKFEDYGVPQARHRVIIVGFRKDLGISFSHPAPTHGPNRQHPHVGTAAALANIPAGAPNHAVPNHKPDVVERLKRIKAGENIWSAIDAGRMPSHLEVTRRGAARISQIYRRMHPAKPAFTLTAKGGGGTQGYHYAENRALTNRERARLQTFPDSFVFEGGAGSVRSQVGMAVPCLGARVIFEAVRDALTQHASGNALQSSSNPFLIEESD